MAEITLYNTRTKAKEPLVPLDPSNVRMYVCGPTVYDRAHIGNARAVVVFDVLYRLLRHTYGADHVTYVRNFTDVDDKINARAAATLRPGETEIEAIRRITDETIGWYHDDMDALGNLRPNEEPRATEFIPQMISMIETLITRGHAYAAEGHVLFSVASFPDYGKLSRRSLDDMRAGARVEVAPYKRDPMDFVLWKPSDAVTPGWPSPWGHGRPGWHIECSAMAYELLGESFDIHGGGSDLAFPHHENELAQSRCAHPVGTFAKTWVHNGMVRVDGEKMSKSVGNILTVDALKYQMDGEIIRYALLSAKYSKDLDWTYQKEQEAFDNIKRWYRAVGDITIKQYSNGSNPERYGILSALKDDLNTPLALQRLNRLADEAERGADVHKHVLKECAVVMGLLERTESQFLQSLRQRENAYEVEIVRNLLLVRKEARERRDFQRADGIRDGLVAAGVEIRDAEGNTTFDLTLNFDSEKVFEVSSKFNN